MKIALYSRPGRQADPVELDLLFGAMERHGLQWQVNEPFAQQVAAATGRSFAANQRYSGGGDLQAETAVMVSYGGDGTFLDAVRVLDTRPIPVVGINSGRLGFLANIPRDGMDAAFADIAARAYTLQERSLLRVEGDFAETPDSPYAFNEMTIQRQSASMIMAEVFVDGEMIATCHGDGVLVSTPSGSTAYSLSVGGPVVAPECNCLVISPIAPHNLTMRPVVVPDTSTITFRVRSREETFYVSLDNQNHSANDGAFFTVARAEKSVFLLHFQNISFYDTLRNKMMWGVDSREFTP